MIDEKLVRHVAELARIGIDEKSVEQLAKELRGILAYVEKLGEVETKNVEAIAHITGLFNSARGDAPASDGGALPPRIDQALLEEQAPGHIDGEVRVPRILQ